VRLTGEEAGCREPGEERREKSGKRKDEGRKKGKKRRRTWPADDPAKFATRGERGRRVSD